MLIYQMSERKSKLADRRTNKQTDRQTYNNMFLIICSRAKNFFGQTVMCNYDHCFLLTKQLHEIKF